MKPTPEQLAVMRQELAYLIGNYLADSLYSQELPWMGPHTFDLMAGASVNVLEAVADVQVWLEDEGMLRPEDAGEEDA